MINSQFSNEYENFATVDYDLPDNDEIASRITILKGSRKGDEIIDTYNSGLKKMKQNGDYEKIFIRYGLKKLLLSN